MNNIINSNVYHIFFKILSHQNLTDNQTAHLLGVKSNMISRYRHKVLPVPPEHLLTLIYEFNYNLIIIQKAKRKR